MYIRLTKWYSMIIDNTSFQSRDLHGRVTSVDDCRYNTAYNVCLPIILRYERKLPNLHKIFNKYHYTCIL